MKYPKWFEKWWDCQSCDYQTCDREYHVCRRIAWNATKYGMRRAAGGSAKLSTQQAKVATWRCSYCGHESADETKMCRLCVMEIVSRRQPFAGRWAATPVGEED